MVDHHLNPLRDRLIHCCRDYTADQTVRAMALAMTIIIVGETRDRAAAREFLDRLVRAMRQHVEQPSADHPARCGFAGGVSGAGQRGAAPPNW